MGAGVDEGAGHAGEEADGVEDELDAVLLAGAGGGDGQDGAVHALEGDADAVGLGAVEGAEDGLGDAVE